jgi:protein-disulfide isomerase
MENNTPSQDPQLDRETRKAEQAKKDRNEARKAKLIPLLRLGGIVLLVVSAIGGLIWIGETQDSGINQPSPISGEVSSVDNVKGPETARLTLIEYSDFQCPTCAAYAPVLEQLHAAYPDDLRIVYRYFPLQSIHPNATIASQAAEAADMQGKFWEFHDKLFDNQATWNRLTNPRDTFTDYAQELGLNVDQFKTDMDSKAAKDRVQADYRSGLSAQVGGTPTFFLNGEPLENPRGFDAFKTVLDAKLQ